MEYFEVTRCIGAAVCSDPNCPCDEVVIPPGTGYVYISPDLVTFRRDCLTQQEVEQKVAQLRSKGTFVAPQNLAVPVLVCEQGARLREIDLDVAAADAKHWWKTGLVPLRASPGATAQVDYHEKGLPPQISELDLEAENLDTARLLLAERTPAGLEVISEEIVSDGQEHVVSGVGATSEEAMLKARKAVPECAQIIRTAETDSPSTRTIRVQAWTEQAATSGIAKSIGVGERIDALWLVSCGRKGFLGIGRSPNDYDVILQRKATVKVTYKQPLKIKASLVERQHTNAAERVAFLLKETASQDRNVQARVHNEIWAELLAGSFIRKFYREMDDALKGIPNPQQYPLIKLLYFAAWNNAIIATLKSVLGTAILSSHDIDTVKHILALNATNWSIFWDRASCLDGERRPYLLKCNNIRKEITAEDIRMVEATVKIVHEEL